MKTDVTITKDLTINCGRYSSIKPAVTMTLKDVDLDKLHSMTEKLIEVVNSTWIIQASLDMREIREALAVSATEYNEALLDRLEEAKGILEQFSKDMPDELFSME